MTLYLSDAAKGPVSIRGTQGHVSATRAYGGSHHNGHQEGGGSLPWLNDVKLMINATNNHGRQFRHDVLKHLFMSYVKHQGIPD